MTYFDDVKDDSFETIWTRGGGVKSDDEINPIREPEYLGPPIQYLGPPNPAIDGDGVEEGVLLDPPIPLTINDQGQITHGGAVIAQPIIAADGKIFGIEPIYLGVAAVALFFLFSSK